MFTDIGYKYIEPVDDDANEREHIKRIEAKIFGIIYKFASCWSWSTDLEMDPIIFETMNFIHGVIGTKDGESIGWCVPQTKPDKKTGIATKWTITYLDATTERDVDINDLCLCFNQLNLLKSDLYLAERFGKLLANIDLSEICNVIYSRNIPIPMVDDDIDKAQIENVINGAIKGRIKAISKSIISKFKRGDSSLQSVEMLPIFNVKSSENLQDLSRFCEEIEKRLFAEIGINISSVDKKAQISSEELNNLADYAYLSSIDKYKQRKKFCDAVNAKFGKSWSVEHIIYRDFTKKEVAKDEEASDAGDDAPGAEADPNEPNEAD